MDMDGAYQVASEMAQRVRALPGVSDVLIPQDVDYPALQINIDRERASELGLTTEEVVDNLITALYVQRDDCAQLLDRPDDGQ